MWTLWRWIFATAYLRSKRKYGEVDAPSWTAVCVVTALMGVNAMTLLIAATWILQVRTALGSYKLEIAALVVVLLGINYVRFVRRGDADDLIQKLATQGLAKARHAERKLLALELASLAAPFLLILLRMWGEGSLS